jgi:hypothetical protein
MIKVIIKDLRLINNLQVKERTKEVEDKFNKQLLLDTIDFMCKYKEGDLNGWKT